MPLLNHLFPRPVVIRYGWLDDKLRLALIKENVAYRAFWKEHGGDNTFNAIAACRKAHESKDPGEELQKIPHEIHLAEVFHDGLDAFGVLIKTGSSLVDLQRALDPFCEEQPDPLPVEFWKPMPVMPVWNDMPIEFECFVPRERVDQLGPSERLLVVDLACRKSEILAVMGSYIDSVMATRNIIDQLSEEAYNHNANYKQWQPDVNRQRQEIWMHLKVWRLRRKRKSFGQISKETGQNVNAAKKAFARAYELINGDKYDQARFKELYQGIDSQELKRTCSACPERNTCADLCPDVLDFINQDQISLSERLAPSRK